MGALIAKFESMFPAWTGGVPAALLGLLTLLVFIYLLRTIVQAFTGPLGKEDAARTRQVALVNGYTVDDIERDMPAFDKENGFHMRRAVCARYAVPGTMTSAAEWTLLCRPGDASTPGFIDDGWQLQVNSGEVSPQLIEVIGEVAHDLGRDDEFFEMEAANGVLYFYWFEHGGAEKLGPINFHIQRIQAQA
ncbi:MAG: hypothetical protein ACAH80_05305 [Alphaproteobacteria bacterium]